MYMFTFLLRPFYMQKLPRALEIVLSQDILVVLSYRQNKFVVIRIELFSDSSCSHLIIDCLCLGHTKHCRYRQIHLM